MIYKKLFDTITLVFEILQIMIIFLHLKNTHK